MTLKIGHIQYANCTPLFNALMSSPCDSEYRFVRGVPSALNQMLRRGDVDLCPSSSIEYGKSPQTYFVLPQLSISSIGPVRSVLLFSRLRLEDLDGKPVGLTTDSDTSVNLLRIILRKRYGFKNEFMRTDLPLSQALDRFSALLLIGDAALRESMGNEGLHVYDLGQLWLEFTGLPFVFALWLVNRKAVAEKMVEVAVLWRRLVAAKEQAYRSYEGIAAGCAEKEWMSPGELVEYWKVISYDLSPDHIRGLDTFYGYAAEMGIIGRRPEVALFPGG